MHPDEQIVGRGLTSAPKQKKNIFIEEVENGFIVSKNDYPYSKTIAKDAYEVSNIVTELLTVQ